MSYNQFSRINWRILKTLIQAPTKQRKNEKPETRGVINIPSIANHVQKCHRTTTLGVDLDSEGVQSRGNRTDPNDDGREPCSECEWQ